MGKMIMNGVSYGINANSTIYGAFIDTTNILKPRTAYAGSFSYTATQDCAVVVEVANATSNSASIFIDGALVGSIYGGNSVNQLTDTYCIKRGQTISGTTGVSGAEVGYTVYGLLYNAGETTNTVIPNPQAVPRDTLDSISIGGMVYDVGSKYGAFINTNRIIQPVVTVQGSTPVEYTATEDCGVVYTVTESGSSQSMVYINDIMIKLDTGKTDVDWLYLRKGDSLRITGNSAKNYTVLGLIQGTNNIFTPQIYSLEEKCVGTWIDNKPLYCKTIEISQYNVTLKNDVWTNICAISDADYMVKTVINTQSPNTAYLMRFQIDNGYLQGAANVQVTLTQYRQLYMTIYYTKSSDVAGSGSYNTLGVPMIHYSTEEQVVGTWIDGKTIYMRTFDFGSDIQVPYNTFIDTTIDAVDKKVIIDAFGIYSTGQTFYPLVANINNGVVRLQACRDNQVALVQYLTIKYTKTTD